MSPTIKRLWQTYREPFLYLVFGVGTTLCDWGVTFALYRLGVNVHVADVLAWIAAVVFAYLTNRRLVFGSRAVGRAVLPEALSFAASRLLTLALQEVFVFIGYDTLSFNKYGVKIAAAVLVVILNYVFSKWFVFRKGGRRHGR